MGINLNLERDGPVALNVPTHWHCTGRIAWRRSERVGCVLVLIAQLARDHAHPRSSHPPPSYQLTAMNTAMQSTAPLTPQYPTLQPAGAFLKQAASGHAYVPAQVYDDYLMEDEKLLMAGLTRADNPTSPTSVSATMSFLASIRQGLDDLKVQEDDDDSDEEDEEDEEDGSSPRYYSSSSNNTYYSPPSSFATSLSPQAFALASDAMLLKDPLFARNSSKPEDDGMIFDMDM
ncbi:hypothetical protein FI667_g14377, partial [Globisporangium splendens]